MIRRLNISILILSSNLRLGVSGRLFPLGIALVQAIHKVSVNFEAEYDRVLKRTISRRRGKSQKLCRADKEGKWNRNIRKESQRKCDGAMKQIRK